MTSKAFELAKLGNAYSDGALSNRNLIINGAMQVAQRGTSVASVSTGGYYTCDRWKFVETGTPTAVYTFTQDTTGPNGFSNSFKVATTTADATPTGLNAISYFVEGFDLQRLGYGSSDANTSTLSFWVKSSQTGTCAVLVYLFDGNLSLTLNYTVDAADTWEYKTLNIPTNTSQAIANDNTAGLELDFVIMADTATYGTTAQTTWDTYSSATRAYGQTLNAAATTSDYFQITGVQLEVGDTATPFEHRSYGQELALCQRYYYDITYASSAARFGWGHSTATTQARLHFQTPVPMRATPSLSVLNVGYRDNGDFNVGAVSGLVLNSYEGTTYKMQFTVSGATAGTAGELRSTGAGAITFDAEL